MNPTELGRTFRVDIPDSWTGDLLNQRSGEQRVDTAGIDVNGVARRRVREDSDLTSVISRPEETQARQNLRREVLDGCEETLRRASVKRGETVFDDEEIRGVITFLNNQNPDFNDPNFNGARYEQMAWTIVDELKQSHTQYSPDELMQITDNLTTVILNNRQ